jgi:beta-phosphoglucomutase
MSTDRLDAVVFDFDGVIVNSEPLHCEAFGRVLGPLGLSFTWDEYLAHYLGFDDRDAFREVFRRRGRSVGEAELRGLIDAKAGAFEELVKEKGAAPFPGVIALIRRIRKAGIPLALCSGALKRDVDPILRQLDIDRAFTVIITADDVAASKPDPTSYRAAIERLTRAAPGRPVRAERAVAIEDTPAGIEAARGAGLKVLAISNSQPREALRDATRVVASLEDVTVRDLEDVVGG